MRVESCRSCEAPIIWTRTSTGRAMPIDADPHPDGTIRPVPDATTVAAQSIPLADRPNHSGQLHRSHFATCPNAAYHRRDKATPR